HDSGTWVGIFSHPAPFRFMQRSPELGPQTGATKLPKVIIHSLPWRKTAWQIAPGAAGTQQIEQGVENGSERVAAEPAGRRSGGQETLHAVPLSSRKVARIACAHSAQSSTCSSPLHCQTRSQTVTCRADHSPTCLHLVHNIQGGHRDPPAGAPAGQP